MWKRLQKKLTIKPTYGTPVRKPRDSQLDRFEAEYEFKLPKSYREFVKLFGAGILDGYFRIYSPAHGGTVETLDLVAEWESMRENLDWLANETFPESSPLLSRAVPFSGTINGDIIVWDPAEKTNSRSHEYTIYIIPRDIGEEITKVADTFREYIEDCCLGDKLAQLFDYSNWDSIWEFVPFGRDRPEPS